MIPHSRSTLSEADAEAVARVVLSGQIAQGPEVEAFERELAAFAGQRDAVAVSSGTAALHLALLALGVGPGAEVVIPTYVCDALHHAVTHAGATPVLPSTSTFTAWLKVVSTALLPLLRATTSRL